MKPEGVAKFYDKVKTAYFESANYLHIKLPLRNNLLRHLSAIDPEAQRHMNTKKAPK